MTAIFYTILLVSVLIISSRAGEAVSQAQFDDMEKAETKSDASATESRLDKLEILVQKLWKTVHYVRIMLENRLDKVEEKLREKQPVVQPTHCNDTDTLTHKVYKDCYAAYNAGQRTSGVYKIIPNDEVVYVFCEQQLDGGGWTVFQRRMGGSEDFYQGWTNYKHGFGCAAGEHWLGNNNIHYLTQNKDQKLKVELQYDGKTVDTDYSMFAIEDETNKFRLSVSGHSGADPPGDSLIYHNGRFFTTKDRDNDLRSSSNCAEEYHGAWWYNNCYHSNLNGRYNTDDSEGVTWGSWKGYKTSLYGVRMMLKTK